MVLRSYPVSLLMACVLRPSRFISINSCMSLPLSTCGPPQWRIGRLYTLVWGWGIFNRLYGDFCTGADKWAENFSIIAQQPSYSRWLRRSLSNQLSGDGEDEH